MGWGEVIKGSLQETGRIAADRGGLWGGIRSSFSLEKGQKLQEAGKDMFWNLPRSLVKEAVIAPTREHLSALVPEAFEGMGVMAKTDLLFDIKEIIQHPINTIIDGARKAIAGGIPGILIYTPLTLIKLPFSFISGAGSAVLHGIADVAKLPFGLTGGLMTTFGSIIGRAFMGVRDAGRGIAVAGDLVERSLNNFLVPPDWQRGEQREYHNIARWGSAYT